METRIMYIECKTGSHAGSARIGRVTFNRTGRSLGYRDQVFRRIVGGGAKSNYIEEGTGAEYWISGCKRRGGDRLHGSRAPVDIDEDVRTEYWRDIREAPEHATQSA
jgi:hypothetical protein